MSHNCTHISPEYFTFNIQNKKIFKDQCMRCYDDQVSKYKLKLQL